MAKSSAMVFSKVVKGGGVGSAVAARCDELLASFDPPVLFGRHSVMQGSKRGYQAEHGGAVASSFHKKGRQGARMPGCQRYETSSALTWMVRDRQKLGTEHKLLTDAMRRFSQKNELKGQKATLRQWLKEYKKAVRDVLKGRDQRAGKRRSKADLDIAAECVRKALETDFRKEVGRGKNKGPMVPLNTRLRNPWKATDAMVAAAKKAASRARRGGAA